MELIIVLPLYNDWASLASLLPDVRSALYPKYESIKFVVVNDGSSEPFVPPALPPGTEMHLVNLSANFGHQRAIILGLCYVQRLKHDAAYIAVMDADGEDRPEELLKLLTACEAEEHPTVVFAERTVRTERFSFRIGYWLYRRMFSILAGEYIRFGNFSCLPSTLIARLTHDDKFWNHFAGAVVRTNIPYKRIRTQRGSRYAGVSSMKTEALVLHGLSALSLYVDRIVYRLFRVLLFFLVLLLAALAVVVYLKTFTTLAIPGWASLLFAAVFNTLITVGSFAFLVMLQQLNRRNIKPEPPANFFDDLVLGVDKFLSRHE